MSAGSTVTTGEDVSVTYELTRASAVRMTLHDVGGRLVKSTWVSGQQGINTCRLDIRELRSGGRRPGVYFLRLWAQGSKLDRGARRIVVVR